MLSARGRHELHARVLNHWFTREASRPFIVQMLATCPHNLSKDAIATSARELYQSVEDGYPLTHSASRWKFVKCEAELSDFRLSSFVVQSVSSQ